MKKGKILFALTVAAVVGTLSFTGCSSKSAPEAYLDAVKGYVEDYKKADMTNMSDVTKLAEKAEKIQKLEEKAEADPKWNDDYAVKAAQLMSEAM